MEVAHRHREERKRQSNPVLFARPWICKTLDCFAAPVIGRRFAPTRRPAMTGGAGGRFFDGT
jgi:hypothetical protein